ncbi:hypothetical protein EVAR_49904_1 [Eumeta japonica]|uniref:Uncharacterized protein n=1 Tax=Eumeta variegata TaxID=151549 RepID=A0A4C1Y494_EUMVA|nr:hypothetical protein EVAR_49904_1 [Eumeta japonica]
MEVRSMGCEAGGRRGPHVSPPARAARPPPRRHALASERRIIKREFVFVAVVYWDESIRVLRKVYACPSKVPAFESPLCK